MYSYTHDIIETLEIQLDELNYFVVEMFKDARVKIPKRERWKIKEIGSLLQNAKELLSITEKEQY